MMTGQESIAFLRPVHREYGRARRLACISGSPQVASAKIRSFAALPTYRWR
jgi:hypothetical protein